MIIIVWAKLMVYLVLKLEPTVSELAWIFTALYHEGLFEVVPTSYPSEVVRCPSVRAVFLLSSGKLRSSKQKVVSN